MNARELMIGDLVRVAKPDRYHGAICRIVSLINHKDDECAYFKVFILTKGNLLHEVCNEDIEPIPLTKEIMFANGFQGNGCKGELVHKTDKQLKIYYDIYHFNGTDWIVKEWSVCGVAGIEYVHEYQHYLRLVGKADLADKFKI